jgi:hypothetical protein
MAPDDACILDLGEARVRVAHGDRPPRCNIGYHTLVSDERGNVSYTLMRADGNNAYVIVGSPPQIRTV